MRTQKILPRPLLFLLLFILPLTLTAQEVSSSWSLTADSHPVPGAEDVHETVWTTARPPEGEFDRIRVHRYQGSGEAEPLGVLLYLPGTFMNGAVAIPEERYNLWLYLARRGVVVYTMDYRTQALGSAELEDPQMLRGWDNAAFVGDVRVAAGLVKELSPGKPFFIGGFSRGVAYAYAYAAAEPEGLAGIVALDGYFKKCHPPGQAAEFDHAAALAHLEASGAWSQDVGGSRGWDARQALMHGARDRPDKPLEEGGAPAGAVLGGVLHRAWGPGVLANPQMPGNEDGVSRPEVLARLMADYDRYFPAIQDVESASLANYVDAPHSSLDDGWAALRKPVILFASTGIGPEFLLYEIASAAHVGRQQTEIHVLERFGHLDVLVGETVVEDVYQPLLDWLLERR